MQRRIFMTNSSFLVLTASLVLAAACTPAEQAGDLPGNDSVGTSVQPPDTSTVEWVGYRAGGNEPFWTITLGATTMDFADMGRSTTASATRPEPERLSSGWR